MKKSIQALVVAAVAASAVVLTGCFSIPGQIQDKTKPLPNGYSVVAPEVSASETMVNVMGYQASDLRGSASRRMYQKCLQQAPGADALIEYTMDLKALNLYFVTVQWYTLTGTAVKSK